MNTLFSIVVPIYNKEQYIKECVESILNQSYINFELILVDDGSSDNSSLICDEYLKIDKRVKVIHKENGGLVSARKKGCECASGDYIACVDADDYVKQDYLLKINEEIEKNHSDIICFGHYVLNKNETKKQIQFEKGLYDKNKIVSKIYPYLLRSKDASYFFVNIWSMVYKRDLYSKFQFKVDDSINIGEDGCVTIPCIYFANLLSIIGEYLYVYRLNDDSMTSKKTVLDLDYPKKVFHEIIKNININEYDFKEQSDRFIVHQLFSLVLSLFNYDKSYKEVKMMIADLLNDPFYNSAIKNAEFEKNFKAKFMHILIKKRFIYIIYLVSKIY